jgi:Terpene cyclase DEP1
LADLKISIAPRWLGCLNPPSRVAASSFRQGKIMTKSIVALTLLAFVFLTGRALNEFGYLGFFDQMALSSASQLAFADLLICLTLIIVWMVKDSRKHGRTIWPFVLVTVVFGAAGPLLYLLLAPRLS